MKIVELSFLDLANSMSIGPIAFGKNINDIGRIIGPPQYWGFGPGARFSMLGTYRDIEIHCRSTNDIVKIYYAELRLSRFTKKRAFLAKNVDIQISVVCPESPRKLTISYLKDYFDSAGVSYLTYPTEEISPSTTGTLRFGENLCFYFSGEREPLLELISIS